MNIINEYKWISQLNTITEYQWTSMNDKNCYNCSGHHDNYQTIIYIASAMDKTSN